MDRAIVIADFCEKIFSKDIVITSIYRSPEEQAILYANDPNPIIHSPHETWEAFDLRSSDFDSEEIQRIKDFANTFPYRNGLPSCLYHVIPGNVYHFHFQVAKPS